MKNVHIMEALTNAIDSKILEEWKHEGFIGGFDSGSINFEIDGKEYVLTLEEVRLGEHWSDKSSNNIVKAV